MWEEAQTQFKPTCLNTFYLLEKMGNRRTNASDLQDNNVYNFNVCFIE